MEPNKIKPAAIGGVALGLLSAIPIVNFVNICCCAWALGGGFLAAFLYNKENGGRGITPGDGATLGAIAGGIAAPIYLVIGVPLGILMQGVQVAIFKSAGIDIPAEAMGTSILGAIAGGFVGAIVLAIFATLGGLIGSLVYKPTGGPAPGGPTYPPAPGAPGAPYGGQGF
jgi:hypothetical protein